MKSRRAVVFISLMIALGVVSGSPVAAAAHTKTVASDSIEQIVTRSGSGPVVMAPGQVANKFSGRCLVVPGGSTADGVGIVQSACSAAYPDQFWHLRQNGGYFHIVNNYTGKCVVIARGNPNDEVQATQSACAPYDDQLWTVQDRYINGWYYGTRYIAKHSGKCLIVPARTNWDGAPVIQYTCVYEYADQWWYQP